MLWMKAIHILGIVFWIGGLLVLSRLLKFRVEFDYDKFTAMIKKIYFSFLLPGFLIAITTGIVRLFQTDFIFFKQGWFHGKLTILLFLMFFTFQLLVEIKKRNSSNKMLAVIHGVTALSLLLIPLFTYLKFGA